MNSLTDLLLHKPIGELATDLLLFIVFALHFFFVLFTIGTAILAFYLFLESLITGQIRDLRWDKYILKTFLAHKSLAVVLGVGALLIIQVGYTVQFFTGITLFAPWWMLIIPLLVISFISFDLLAHSIDVHHIQHLIFGSIALIALLIVPAIFVTVLVAAENSAEWITIAENGFKLSGSLAVHWLFRYMHVLGAAIVFGATFHLFYASNNEPWKEQKLFRWIVGGIFFQILIGILLFGYLPKRPEPITVVVLCVGIIAVLTFLWIIFRNHQENKKVSWIQMLTLLLIVLVPMLLTRQFLQNQSIKPLNRHLEAAAGEYSDKLSAYNKEALTSYQADLDVVYNNGPTIYKQSCSFCHGVAGDGNGSEAIDLKVKPEALGYIRTGKHHLLQHMKDGVAGTGMPYFSYFDDEKLESVIKYLDDKFGVLGEVPVMNHLPGAESQKQAAEIYAGTCKMCHGADGKGTKLSAGFKPSTPDFTEYTLAPQYAYQIIKNGYPGTMMQAYPDIPEETTWGLVKIINGLYNKNRKGE